MSTVDILVVGSGGREHALAWKLRRSPRCGRLYAAPGNAGIAAEAECLPCPVSDLAGLVAGARERKVGLVVVGPEAPLAAGLADRLRDAGILVFGPSAGAARIESSKAYARHLMARMDVPQPEHAAFRDWEQASRHLRELEARGIRSVVIKASGLAAGKGAVVCDTMAAAADTAREMLVEGSFGAAGAEVLVEERLEGEEVSLFVLTDGREILTLPPAQDYKRVYDGDRGPNTGGMGSHAPAPLMTADLLEGALRTIIRPVLRGLEQDGTPFQGCLYAGLIRTAAGLKVIEFNCRLGDPETQAVLPLLDEDLLEPMLECARGALTPRPLRWKPERAVSVVLASGGYPDAYATGKPITGLEEAAALPGVTLFHAGTALKEGEVVTAGGRVLCITAQATTFAEAVATAYEAAGRVEYEGKQLRTDIGARVTETK